MRRASCATPCGPRNAPTEALLRAYVDQETGERGFLLTGDTSFLAPYDTGRSQAKQLEATLAGLSTSPETDRLRDEVIAAATRWRTQVAEPEVARRRAGPIQAAELVSSAQEGKRLFDEVRVQVAALSTSLAALVAVELDRFDTAQTYADWAALTTMVLVLFAAVLGLAALRYLLTRPLHRLLTQVRAVADGDYTRPIDPAGPREVVSIALAAEQMRAGLIRYSDELVVAQERLSVAAERDRLVNQLQEGTTARLTSLGVSLTGLVGRHPSAGPDLIRLVGETDQVLAGLRQAIFAVEARTDLAEPAASVGADSTALPNASANDETA